MKLTIDPTLTVPAHVIEAARLIHNYFAEQGTDSWELMGICSRDRVARLEEALRLISDGPLPSARRLAEIADRALEGEKFRP